MSELTNDLEILKREGIVFYKKLHAAGLSNKDIRGVWNTVIHEAAIELCEPFIIQGLSDYKISVATGLTQHTVYRATNAYWKRKQPKGFTFQKEASPVHEPTNLLKERKDFWNVPCNPITGWNMAFDFYVNPKITEDTTKVLHDNRGYKKIA